MTGMNVGHAHFSQVSIKMKPVRGIDQKQRMLGAAFAATGLSNSLNGQRLGRTTHGASFPPNQSTKQYDRQF